ncbi:MAG TPA: patatin-like phospholipase family protein [Solirubrobacterales bacterium]|nr:patatin-like phospholipase family protein [Solirubrobacterales bacterium]
MAGFHRPDALVLGGGGVLGEAWMTAVLAGLADAAGFDPRECGGYVGTSAGSIVAAALAAGVEPRSRLGELPEQPSVPTPAVTADESLAGRTLDFGLAVGRTAAAPLAVLGLRSSEAGGAVLRRAALSRVPAGRRSLAHLGRELERAGARWDGRLSVAAVELESGRRVMFGEPGAPQASVGAAVEASCAIPGVFRPIVVGGRSYVDGGAWSPTNMDRAPAGRGTRVLCLNPTGSMRSSLATPIGGFGLLSRSLAALEALALERRGARVTTVSPDRPSLAAMGANLMDPGPRSRVIAAGLAQGLALGSERDG